tara:strand:+ start:444 stop:1277 length:834 start_codon:yes stop_codon:yes gene_type:complete
MTETLKKDEYAEKIPNKDLRRRVIEEGSKLGFGHYCTAMSCIDTCAYLYDEVLGKDDLFILGKGHGIIAVLPILEKRGLEFNWQPYLDFNPKKGIEATTGSLGHGLPISLGRAYAKKVLNEPGKVYCMVGDGELQEGSNWEALSIANKLEKDGKLGNLVVMVDWNKYQAVDSVKDVMGLDDKVIQKRLEAFGCDVQTINGHDPNDLAKLKDLKPGLNGIILDTIKGRGVRYLEDNPSFHVIYLHHHTDEFKQCLTDFGATPQEVDFAFENLSKTKGH